MKKILLLFILVLTGLVHAQKLAESPRVAMTITDQIKCKTLIKIKFPKGLNGDYIEVPSYIDPDENIDTLQGKLEADGFYTYRLNLEFPKSIKMGPRRILIIPTDTVIIDYSLKPNLKNSDINHLEEIKYGLNQYKLLGIISSSQEYKLLSPMQFEQRMDSFYEAGNKFILKYINDNKITDRFSLYYAQCELLFKIGTSMNNYCLLNFRDSIKKSSYRKDFFKYNKMIFDKFNKLFFSEYGYNYFNSYAGVMMYYLNPYKDYGSKLKWIYDNTSGIIRDIVIGRTIAQYQLRRFDPIYLPVSKEYALKIKDFYLRNDLITKINTMERSQILIERMDLPSKNIISTGKTMFINDLLKPFTGKVLYVELWATWCGPCVQDAEYLDDLNKEIKNDDFKIINICVQSPKMNYDKHLTTKSHFGNHIFLDNIKLSEFMKEVPFPHLPYYLLIDNKKNIIIKDAPRPTPIIKNKVNEELIKSIKSLLDE